ncbi:unnamed protein product [Peniophora sp. CBMAI 1063]|nr:unnamed protein product [Peniophora sp. CBMAI 1063]
MGNQLSLTTADHIDQLPAGTVLADEDTARQLIKDALSNDPRKLGDDTWGLFRSTRPPQAYILDLAIYATQLAVDLDNELGDLRQLHYDLGVRLCARSTLSGSLDDLDEAILAFQRAIDLSSDDETNQPEQFSQLGLAKTERFKRLGEIHDIDDGVMAFRRAVELTPDDRPVQPWRYVNLGLSFRLRFELTRMFDDIEQAVLSHRRAVELAPEDHPDRFKLFDYLGNSLLARSQHTSGLDDIEEATLSHRHALELIPNGHADNPLLHSNLGKALALHFERSRGLGTLEQAVASYRCALELTPDDHSRKPSLFQTLGHLHSVRFDCTGEPGDIEQAISSYHSAVELTPDDQPDKPQLCIDAGNLYRTRFQRTGGLRDIGQAITFHRQVIALLPEVHPSKPAQFNNLGRSLLLRFQRSGESDDIEQSILSHRRALELAPEGHTDNLAIYNDLGTSLFRRFEHAGELDDIGQAISWHHRASNSTPDDHPDKPTRIGNLGNSLSARFARTGQLQDIEQAVSCNRRAVELVPDSHPDKSWRLSNLGASLRARFRRTGEPDDLEQAVLSLRRAVELTPDGHPDKPAFLNNLEASLSLHPVHTGELDDADQEITLQRRVLEFTPDGHPNKPGFLNNVGNSLLTRFARTDDLDDLDQAITFHRRAVQLLPQGHSIQSLLLNSLGNSLTARFKRTLKLDDIEEAISLHRRAVGLIPDCHPSKSLYLNHLGSSLATRFESAVRFGDIAKALSMQNHYVVDPMQNRHLIKPTPSGRAEVPSDDSTPHSPSTAQPELVGELESIEQNIASLRVAIELMPASHPDKPARLNELGDSLSKRFTCTRQLDDIKQAISTYGRAVELAPSGHPDKPLYLSNVSNSSLERWMHLERQKASEQGISALESTAVVTAENSNDRGSRVGVGFENKTDVDDEAGWPERRPESLGRSLIWHFKEVETAPDFDAAIKSFMEATLHPSGSPSTRLDSAKHCARLLTSHPSNSGTESLLSAHSRLIDVLPEIIWLGHDILRRYEEASRLGELVNAAVSSAIAADALTRAVEWLEAGRALIWTQILSLRTPLDQVQKSQSKLAIDLQSVRERLLLSAKSNSAPEMENVSDVPGLKINHAAEKHRALAIEYGDLLKEIRACEGFDGFLRPQQFATLTAPLTALNGPIVFINVHESRCDALLLYPDGQRELVPLLRLTSERADQLHSLWTTELAYHRDRLRDPTVPRQGALPQDIIALSRHTSHVYEDGDDLSHLLKCLWEWIVYPVLENLQVTETNSSCLPHLTWCPTGPLTQLPLHAAGIYDDPSGPRAFEFAVSSYTPSLSALLRCLESIGKREASPAILVVTQPNTPKCSRLPGTLEEERRLRKVLGAQITSGVYNHDKATVKSIQDVMAQYPWIHLACHGSQNRADPTKSAFRLYDGPLTLSDLMSTVSENAELAFLSACQTAVGDKDIPEESAHLAAGMLAVGFKGVVATMWSIMDADAPVVVEAYYKELIALRNSGSLTQGETGAAYALHEATKVLREKVGEANFMRWVPFVHFGA